MHVTCCIISGTFAQLHHIAPSHTEIVERRAAVGNAARPQNFGAKKLARTEKIARAAIAYSPGFFITRAMPVRKK